MPRISRIVAVDFSPSCNSAGVRSMDIFNNDDDRQQRSTLTGRPAVSHDFVKRVTGRTLQKQKPGPKKKIEVLFSSGLYTFNS